MKIKKTCSYCNNEFEVWPSYKGIFCSKSCFRTYKNYIENPSWFRDLSGENNPMYGKHPVAWNIGAKGEASHNWRGGIHKRKDGYYRINVDGKRYLLHRYISGVINEDVVVHHKDGNPSNNDIDNLEICDNQSLHISKFHKKNAISKMAARSSKG